MMTLPVSYLDDLHNYICAVQFTKKDGTVRDMICTLREDVLPAQTDIEENIQKKKPNADIVSVWDIDNKGWRSFRKDAVISFNKQNKKN